SIVADPNDPLVVYVGGDRQPLEFQSPTSIGATEYSGRLFRGDASQPPGSQWVHLTHSNTLGASGGGTASSSAPHADSREMVFDAAGNIVEVDDGGVYRRTQPQNNQGDWSGISGDLLITEVHDVAWDAISNTVISGNQDVGTTFQANEGDLIWKSVSTGDGGDVAVDDISLSGSSQSIRYSSSQNLTAFRRRIYDAAGMLVSTASPGLIVSSGAALVPAFRTPVVINSVEPTRLVIQGTNGVYESLNQGNNITQLNSNDTPGNTSKLQNAVVAGGMLSGVPNPDVLWVGGSSKVFLRNTPGGNLNLTATQPTTDSAIRGLAVDDQDWRRAFVIDDNQVSWTQDGGAHWTDITGNLMSLTNSLYSILYVSTALTDALLVGTSNGVLATPLGNIGTTGEWHDLGSWLPNALVMSLDFDSIDNVLLAGTFGRGVWSLPDPTGAIIQQLVPFDYGDAPAPYPVRPDDNGARHAAIGPFLGTSRDSEVDGVHSAGANGDDLTGSDDEDGVQFLTTVRFSNDATIRIKASQPGFVDAWIDFNDNGSWLDSGDQILTSQAVVAGDNDLVFHVPSGTTPVTAAVVRVRISSAGGLIPTGTAADGEVEDLTVMVKQNAPDPPTLLAPPLQTNDDRPLLQWTAVTGAVSYEVWVNNATTNTGKVFYAPAVTETSVTPENPLIPGRHIVWVRAKMSSGE
ncbi:MAG: hypothetical protein KDA96_25380, partial [Planctomycetaceae bacterium]|nr:hypothetical protein [Planctomycetaceae bacterium]